MLRSVPADRMPAPHASSASSREAGRPRESAPPPAPPPPPPPGRGLLRAGAGLLVLATLAAWSNSLAGPFVFDDTPAIIDNPTIRHLWPLGPVLSPAGEGGTVGGRPVVNLTLALNHALGGTHVAGYHVLNLLVHVLAGLTLFGLARRTLLRRPAGRAPLVPGPTDAALLALAVALLWTLHPLQTEAVTYVIQRAESLMGLFYLVTLYGFARALDSPRPRGWLVLSWVACLLGMGTKEVMASAPLLVLLYDRTFAAGGFREAWRRRRGYYAALAASWLLLAWLVVRTENRGGSAGFDTSVTSWAYALTQCRAIVRYLTLALWPHPLVFDYGDGLAAGPLAVAPQALLLLLLLAGTAVALWRRPVLGFLGAWFFLILAPSSSIVPVVTQTLAEHRMYLPLAAVVAAVAGGAWRLLGRRSLVLCAALALALGAATFARNRDYRDEFTLWSDTLTKDPDNARAANNVGSLWLKRGDLPRAVPYFLAALALKPGYASAHYNLGVALAGSGSNAEAVGQFQAALRHDPNSADIHINLGVAWLKLGRPADARDEFQTAIRLQPESPDAQYDLGLAFAALGQPALAAERYEVAIRLQPDLPGPGEKLGEALARTGRVDQAIAAYQAALQLQPDRPSLHFALGNLLAQAGRPDAAIAEFQQAVRLDPADLKARNNLGNALLMKGRVDEAIREYEEILRRQPDNDSVRENLQAARAMRSSSGP